MFAKVLNYSFLIFLILTVKAPSVWGFSVSRTQDYLRQAQEQKIWNDLKWIKLGHYKKHLFGYSSSFRGKLFINDEGYDSPEKELLTSIQALFSDSPKLSARYKKHPQCQFLARRKWLLSRLKIAPEDVLPCAEQQEWKKKLHATSVAVIFASADLGNPASSFGHTFLKLINPDNARNKDLIDYGVNYAADANPNDGVFYAVRGLFGGYRGIYTMQPYHQKIREYINLEGRDIIEYHLNLTADEVDELIDHLNELEFSSAPYYFLTDNCSYEILYALDVIRPELDLSDKFGLWVIPADTIKVLSRDSSLIADRKFKKSLNNDYLENFAQLNLLQRKALDEAVNKLKISPDYELTPAEKAEVFETAMKYYAVEGYKSDRNTDNEKYQLAIERASLGPITQERPPEAPQYPELSHDSSAIYIGYGQLQNMNYSLLKFRSAYHDLEQNDFGLVPMSLIQAGVLEFRYYDEVHKLSFSKFTFMNLINTVPATQLDQNLSWKARIDVVDSFRPDVEYAIGQSYDVPLFSRSRISYFLTGRYTDNELRQHIGQAGPEILFVSRPFDKLGFSMDLSYLAQTERTPYLRFKAKLDYEIKHNYDLQISGEDTRDYQFTFLKNFIF